MDPQKYAHLRIRSFNRNIEKYIFQWFICKSSFCIQNSQNINFCKLVSEILLSWIRIGKCILINCYWFNYLSVQRKILTTPQYYSVILFANIFFRFKRNQKTREMVSHTGKVHTVDWSTDGKKLASGIIGYWSKQIIPTVWRGGGVSDCKNIVYNLF